MSRNSCTRWYIASHSDGSVGSCLYKIGSCVGKKKRCEYEGEVLNHDSRENVGLEQFLV